MAMRGGQRAQQAAAVPAVDQIIAGSPERFQ